MQEYVLKVEQQDANMRLDLFLMEFSKKNDLGLSRTFIQRLISEGKVAVNNSNLINLALATSLYTRTGLACKGGIKPHFKVKRGDEIRIQILDKKPSILKAEEIPLDIIYEDDDLA